MQILRASEDYLETMLMLQQECGSVRSVDVARRLNVSRPSVTNATKRLRQSGHITMDESGAITLTPSGLQIARGMLSRHRTLAQLLMRLGVDAETAEKDACKLEHDISDETFRAICSLADSAGQR